MRAVFHRFQRGLSLAVLPVAVSGFLACGDDGSDPQPDATDTTISDGAGDPDASDAEEGTEEVEVVVPIEGPGSLVERGYTEHRVVAHIHSAYSHDACDGEGLDENGDPDWECVTRLKKALCSERIALAFMTDHPSHMRDQPFEDLLYADIPSDDELLVDEETGDAWGIRFACDEGEGGADNKVIFLVGFEGTHTLPIGLRRHLDPISLTSVAFKDTTPTADLEALTQAVREAGGRTAVVHAEGNDMSAELLLAHDVSAVEFYNFHANFKALFGNDFFDALVELEHFLGPNASGDPNLSMLVMLGTYPDEGLRKWREIAAQKEVVTFGGSDVHENVSFGAICTPDTCEDLAEDYPNLVDYLRTGGPIWQRDGQRLDAYARIFRFLQNRVFLAPGETADRPEPLEEAFFQGRAYTVFEIFGNPDGLAFVAEDADGALYEIGETAPAAPGSALYARLPSAPMPAHFAEWDSGAAAEMEAVLWQLLPDGAVEVARWSEPDRWQRWEIEEEGVYQLELWIRPTHLEASLGSAAYLVEESYRWVQTNPIRFR